MFGIVVVGRMGRDAGMGFGGSETRSKQKPEAEKGGEGGKGRFTARLIGYKCIGEDAP